MADTLTTQSTTLSTIPAASVIATDDAGASGHVQIVKLAQSADGSASPIAADANGLEVQGAGVAGTPAGGVVSVQGVASGTVLPVSASSLPLPSGAATLAEQQTQTASLSVLDDWDESDRAKVNIIAGQAGITAGAGAVAASTPRVTLASDDPAVVALQILDNAISGSEIQADIITVPAPLSTTGGGTEATALRVTIANDSTGVVSVDDNGGSLTVDGTVSVSGTVDTELPTAAALADNTSNPTVPAVGAFAMLYDGSTWDRQPGNSTEGALVHTKRSLTASAPTNAAVSNTSGSAVASNANRKGLILRNTSTAGQRISLHMAGGTAVLNDGVTLDVGDAFVMGEYDFTTAAITAIASATSARLSVQEMT